MDRITSPTKDISFLKDFSFVQLYEYLINSKDKTFDKESMKVFKSLKAYRYFADGLVTTVRAYYTEEDQIVIKGYCYSSLKAKTTYTVYVILNLMVMLFQGLSDA